MFSRSMFDPDCANPRAPIYTSPPDSALSRPLNGAPQPEVFDPIEQMAAADAADRTLLRLMIYAAAATMLLAVASSMV